MSLLFLGMINSLLFSGILVLINLKLSQRELTIYSQYDWVIFIVLLVASVTVSRFFQRYLIKLTNKMTFDFELTILSKIKSSSLLSFERLGFQRIYTALEDTRALGQIPESLVNVINAVIIIMCGVGYLFWVSAWEAIGILAVMVFLLISYLARNNTIERKLNQVRNLQESFHRYIRDLLMGFKEAKMSSVRTENMFEDFLMKNRKQCKELNTQTAEQYLDNELTGNYSWYVVLGVILFVLPLFSQLQKNDMAAFVITVLYLMGPVAVLVAVLPYYTRVKIALERITRLENDIALNTDSPTNSGLTELPEFDTISFRDVVFEYADGSTEKGFKVGPIDVEIKRGELIFVTGGNGSGKSTFVKLLTGLYPPTSGNICMNDSKIGASSYASYRNEIAAVFTDNYLFSENYDGFDLSDKNLKLAEFVGMMNMTQILRIENQKFDLNLSKGQMKRLALINGLLEDKPVLVLDEWAAEQDPEFRRYFYREILPILLQAGKTIIAVTHDDQYTGCAQRLIRFDFGTITRDVRIPSKEEVVN